MTRLSVEFFAAPDEQIQWLRDFLAQGNNWLLAWLPDEGKFWPLTPQNTAQLPFTANAEDSLVLFLGKSSLAAEPVWRTGPTVTELDFVLSRAIQFVPSLVYEKRILLEGRAATLHREAYAARGQNFDPLAVWFRQLAKSLAKFRLPGTLLVQKLAGGGEKRWPRVIVSHGAAMWKKGGRLLKQFPRGEVEFDLEQPTPCQ